MVVGGTFSTLQPLSPQTQCCKPVATLTIFPWQIFMRATTRHATGTESKHTHFPCLPNVRREFYQERFFLRTVTLRNRFLCGCFPKHFNLAFFKSRIIFLHYLHNFHLQPPSLRHILITSFIISISTITLI